MTEPRGRALAPVGGWLLFAGACTALAGVAGLAAAVVVAAVLLARLPHRVLGALGVVALAAVPLVVVGRGLPSEAEVSPFFVSGSLWPHHLAFGGLVLVGAWAVLDVRRRLAGGTLDPVPAPPPRPPLAIGVAIVALVALGAVAATLAVLQT